MEPLRQACFIFETFFDAVVSMSNQDLQHATVRRRKPLSYIAKLVFKLLHSSHGLVLTLNIYSWHGIR